MLHGGVLTPLLGVVFGFGLCRGGVGPRPASELQEEDGEAKEGGEGDADVADAHREAGAYIKLFV